MKQIWRKITCTECKGKGYHEVIEGDQSSYQECDLCEGDKTLLQYGTEFTPDEVEQGEELIQWDEI